MAKPIRNFFSTLFRLGVVASFVAMSPLAVAKAPRTTQKPDLILHLTPQKGKTKQSKGLAVSYTLSGVSQAKQAPLALRFDTLEPALERAADKVGELHAKDADGELLFASPVREKAEGRTFEVFTASRPFHGELRVTYLVPLALTHPLKRGPHLDLQAAGGVSGALVSVLLLPKLQGQIHSSLVWHMNHGEHAVTTFGYGNSNEVTTMADLENALFLAGPLQMYRSPMRVGRCTLPI